MVLSSMRPQHEIPPQKRTGLIIQMTSLTDSSSMDDSIVSTPEEDPSTMISLQ
jgi:hypothetical protein